jgi:hypothetical protein
MVDVAARTRQAFDVPRADRIDNIHEHNRHRAGRLFERSQAGGRRNKNDFGRKRNKLRRVTAAAVGVDRAPANIDSCIASECLSPLLQSLMERCDAGLSFRIVGSRVHEKANAPHALTLLCARCERPRSRRAAEQRDELTSSHVEHRHSRGASSGHGGPGGR